MRYILPVLLLVTVCAAWEVLPGALGLPGYILPPLSEILLLFLDTETLAIYASNSLVTLQSALYGLLLGGGLGFVLALILHQSRLLMMMIYPYIVALQCMPKIAIAPLLIVWFGFGMASKVVIVALLCFFPLLVNTLAGLSTVSRDSLDLFRAMGARRLSTMAHLLIPAALPSILAGLEVAVVVAMLGAIVGEFVGAQEGLGVLMLQAQSQMNIAAVFSILGVLAVLGVTFNLALQMLRKRLLFWIVRPNTSN